MGIRKWINGRWEPPFTIEEEEASIRRFDDMVKTGRTPGVMTDAVFLEGRCNGNQFEKHPEVGDELRRVAEAHGQSTKGKVYLGGLANFPGDPQAWVDGRGDVEKVARERGFDVNGAVSVRGGGSPPRAAVPLAADLLEDYVEAEADRQDTVVTEDLVERVKELRTPHWAKK